MDFNPYRGCTPEPMHAFGLNTQPHWLASESGPSGIDFFLSVVNNEKSIGPQFIVKNKNRKMEFSFVSAHCASFMKIGLLLGGGGREGVCIFLVRKHPKQHISNSILT